MIDSPKEPTGGINEITAYPHGPVEIDQLPNGDFMLHWSWPSHQITLILTHADMRLLNGQMLDAMLLARAPKAVEA